MDVLSVLVILFSLALIMYLALKGFSIIVIAPLTSIVVIFLTQLPLLETLQDTYMGGFINFAKKFYLIFLLAAMFGKLMEDSGAARTISKSILRIIGRGSKLKVLIAIVAVSAILTYGGVSVFVVIFAVLPIAKPLFKELDIPWHLFMAAFFFGAATFSNTMLAGTPSSTNIIPTGYLGTTVSAAPLIGLVASITVIIFNIFYLKREIKKSEKKGETYFNCTNLEGETDQNLDENKKLPNLIISIIPPIFLLTMLNFLKIDIVYSLMISVVIAISFFWKFIDKKIKTINGGAKNTVLPLINTSADVGYGSVIAATAGFAVITHWLSAIPGSPLISLSIATNLLAGITGSSSGGLAIAMETLSKTYMQYGLNPEVIHRISTIAAGGFDALPHNGGVITFLAVAGLTHKDAYRHVFMTGVVGPVIALIPALIVATTFY